MIIPAMRCDRCGRMLHLPTPVVDRYSEIRSVAARAGWHVSSPSDFDICRQCLAALA